MATDVVLHEVEPLTDDGDARPLTVNDEDARALYEALARYFGGSPDMATLRRDYDAERARVDLFIQHLTAGHG